MSNLSSNDGGLSREIYQRHRLHGTMRRESNSSSGGGGVGGVAYDLFSPTGIRSSFSLDARAFRFDFDDLRTTTRSNLPSLTTQQEESEETEVDDLRRWSEAERRREEEDGRSRRRSELLPELEMKRFKLEVLRNILANFSLEKTIEKYRNMSIKQFTLKPSDYSFDCAVPANQLKDKLFRMTGSDQIKINDRHFVKQLQKILETEDQERTKKEFEERSASEYQRLKKLMQQGVIDAKELREHHRLLDRIPEDCGTLTRRSNRGTRRYRGQATTTTTKLDNRSQHQQNKSLSWRSSMMKDSSFSTISSSTIIGNQLKSTQSEDNLRLPAIAGGSRALTMTTNAGSVSSGNLSRPSQRRKKTKTSRGTKAAVAPSTANGGCTDRHRNAYTAAVPEDKKLTMVGLCTYKTSSSSTAALDSSAVNCASQRLPVRSSGTSESDRPLIR